MQVNIPYWREIYYFSIIISPPLIKISIYYLCILSIIIQFNSMFGSSIKENEEFKKKLKVAGCLSELKLN